MLAVTHYAALLAIMPLDFQQSLPIAQVKKISEKKGIDVYQEPITSDGLLCVCYFESAYDTNVLFCIFRLNSCI